MAGGTSGASSPRSLKSKARAGIGHPFVGAETGVVGLRPATHTGRQAPHRGTPPVDVRSVTAGLLARGSRRLSGLPGASAPVARLTAALRLQLRGQPRP